MRSDRRFERDVPWSGERGPDRGRRPEERGYDDENSGDERHGPMRPTNGDLSRAVPQMDDSASR